MPSVWTSLKVCRVVNSSAPFCQRMAHMYSDYFVNPLPDNKFLDRSKLKQIADDILKCV